MYHHFSKEFFVSNRLRLRELFVGTAPIVITANGVLQRNGDGIFSFRQDSSFWYLTGIKQSDVVLVMDKTKDYLILPTQQDYLDIFHGRSDPIALQAISGIDTIYKQEEGWKRLNSRLKRAKHVATLSATPAYVEQLGFYANPARAQLLDRIKLANTEVELLDLNPQLSLMRVLKQKPELEALQEAINITVKAINFVQKRHYDHEYQLEAEITRQFRKAGTQGHAFTPIISAGANACILHRDENDATISDKDLITLDIGAEVDNYSADISRTYSQAKQPSKRQRAVHDAVISVQDYAFSLVKPGALIIENEKLVEHYMGEKLRELGLIQTINRDSVRKYFPHSTSHFLGLDAHDTGDYSRPLEPSMVITVEPGIYIPEEGIGIRIEDDVLITTDGYKVMSDKLPRSIC
ncbi:MAG: aminopeptidase P N-terminal domain-containing protein [Candidatus Saccharibacteria bacterium]